MSYNEKLAERIRQRFAALPNVEEKAMMGGLALMYNDKMCVGIMKNQLMCRVAPELVEELVEKPGARTMDFTGRPMHGYILVEDDAIRSDKDFEYWINLALEFNPKAKSSKKTKRS